MNCADELAGSFFIIISETTIFRRTPCLHLRSAQRGVCQHDHSSCRAEPPQALALKTIRVGVSGEVSTKPPGQVSPTINLLLFPYQQNQKG